MTETIRLVLPLIQDSQAQKHVTHNEALKLLDAIVQAGVIDKDLTSPPGSPSEGDIYAALQVARVLAHDRTCTNCAGTGWVQGPEVTTHRGRFLRRDPCPACTGTGRQDTDRASTGKVQE